MKKKRLLILLFCLLRICVAQQIIPLYNGQISNSKPGPDEEQRTADDRLDTITTKVSVPTLTVFFPAGGRARGAAVIICPGGGYKILLTKREGSDIARAFTRQGVTAFVLKYRLPDDKIMNDKSIGSLQDAQQAIRTVRLRAKEWKIDPEKIGIMGFSAGGHLAATAGTHFNSGLIANPDSVSLRPDFMILIYPVISFTEALAHKGSREALLGPEPSLDRIKYFSNELQVDRSTPPTFLTHASDDTVVPVENSLEFYRALKQNKVSAELHIYARGEHGYLKNPPFEEWFGRCVNWMRDLGFVQ